MIKNEHQLYTTLFIIGTALLITANVATKVDSSNDEKSSDSFQNNIVDSEEKAVTYYSSSLVESERVKFEDLKPLKTDNTSITDSENAVTLTNLYYKNNTNDSNDDNDLPKMIIPDEETICDSMEIGSESESDSRQDDFESLAIPSGETDCYGFMDYRTLTDTSSKQWELQQSAWTDWQGFRRIGNDYCVALGTYYGEIGDRFRITTDEGNSYTVIEADAKGNDAVFYNDYQSWYHVCGNGRINLIEFVVDGDLIPNECWQMGDMGVIDSIGGNVVSIERID